jgi:adenylate cyclase
MERKLTAILSADVKGYSRLMDEDEEATLHTLTAYRAVMDPLISQYRGRIVGTAGDSVLAEFASVIDAVRCAGDPAAAQGPERCPAGPAPDGVSHRHQSR